MFKRNVTYTDFNDKPHNEDLYFHMMTPEMADLAYNPEFGPGGLRAFMHEAMGNAEQDNRKIYMIFKLLVVNSYGRRSEDGSKFIKRAEYTEEFLNSPAWEQLFLWLTDSKEGDKNSTAFWEGICPPSMKEEIAAVQQAAGTDIKHLSRDELEALVNKTLAERRSIESPLA